MGTARASPPRRVRARSPSPGPCTWVHARLRHAVSQRAESFLGREAEPRTVTTSAVSGGRCGGLLVQELLAGGASLSVAFLFHMALIGIYVHRIHAKYKCI